MIDPTFSKASFDELDLVGAKTLSSQLDEVVLKRLQNVMDDEITAIVEELNLIGHSLQIRHKKQLGDIGYLEKNGLRLNVDTIVSIGFDDLVG